MKIAVLVEGATEDVFKEALQNFLCSRLETTKLPSLRFISKDGRLPTGEKLKKDVERLLNDYDAVIALTDVYTGTEDFTDATDAKNKMRQWVGSNEKFYPHAAQYDFEAWLLPYWDAIQKLSGTNTKPFANEPERVNHNKPPAHRLRALFESRNTKKSYKKPRDAARILRDKDLSVAANACPELKAFLNTILTLSGGEPLA